MHIYMDVIHFHLIMRIPLLAKNVEQALSRRSDR